MEKCYFAIRVELREEAKINEKLKEHLLSLLKNGHVYDLTILSLNSAGEIVVSSPAFPGGGTYDVTRVQNFSVEKRNRIIDKIVATENGCSFIYTSLESAIEDISHL